jgi:hypothetical protein
LFTSRRGSPTSALRGEHEPRRPAQLLCPVVAARQRAWYKTGGDFYKSRVLPCMPNTQGIVSPFQPIPSAATEILPDGRCFTSDGGTDIVEIPSAQESGLSSPVLPAAFKGLPVFPSKRREKRPLTDSRTRLLIRSKSETGRSSGRARTSGFPQLRHDDYGHERT